MRFLKKLGRLILKLLLLAGFGFGLYCLLFGLNGIYGDGSSLEENVYKFAASTISSISSYIPVSSEGQMISDDETASLHDSGISAAVGDFEAEFYPYYSTLSEKGKEVYKKAYANAAEYSQSFLVTNGATTKEAQRAVEALFNDHPEIFWLETKYSYLYTEKGICVQVALNYNMSAEEIAQAKPKFEAAVQEVLSGALGLASNYDREKYVHDYIAKNTDYDVNERLCQSAYSALVLHRSVCAGYSRAFQCVMTRLGIPTYYVIGYSNGSHAWNIVKLDDGYYNVDVTWDDSWPVSYAYFNRTDADISETHSRDDVSNYLPACNATAYRNLEHSFGQGLFGGLNEKPSAREETPLPRPEPPEIITGDDVLPDDNPVVIVGNGQQPNDPDDSGENVQEPEPVPNSPEDNWGYDPNPWAPEGGFNGTGEGGIIIIN